MHYGFGLFLAGFFILGLPIALLVDFIIWLRLNLKPTQWQELVKTEDEQQRSKGPKGSGKKFRKHMQVLRGSGLNTQQYGRFFEKSRR